MIRTATLATLAYACLAAATLSQGERDRAMSHLHATRKMFLDAVTPLTEVQWNFKPAPDRWSVSEVAEHLAVTEELIIQRIGKVLAGPAEPGKKPEERVKDELVLRVIADRSQKAQAPEVIRPTGRYRTRAGVVEAFRSNRDRTIEFVSTTQQDLRSHFSPHPAAGMLDCYQWTLLLAAHTDRHVQQMREVMADPGFPKK